jgi:MYXO-CTERM domain-containing protein
MNKIACLIVACALAATGLPARAAFHFMQIEQVIGGVNGDNTAQAIQLRMRTGGQNIVSLTRVRAWDATGLNPVLLLDITADVAGAAAGSRVLLTTPSFNAGMVAGGHPGFTGDFTLAVPIPASYLAAGKVTFEDDGGTIYWSLAWGGASYTGTNLGSTTNDADGNFGAPFGTGLPTAGRQGPLFTGPASAVSTNNLADYALSADPATVTKNNGSSFTVVPEPGLAAFFGAVALGAFLFTRRRAR